MKNLIKRLKFEFNKVRIRNKTKFFCIGSNKTGTTSIKFAFKELGFIVGNQRKAEILMDDYLDNKFESIIRYCKSAEVFQDVPFSYPETYKHLDKAYPNSKFILTVRDSPEQWYNSLTKFHAKCFGNGNIPSIDDLKNADYIYKGWVYKNIIDLYNLDDNDDPYNKEKLITHYNKYNQDIIDYFKTRPNDLLILNLSESNAYNKFCNFINVKSERNDFPWENKTENIIL